ncbi:hypothetical protein D3C83_103100 [compost metagenome]
MAWIPATYKTDGARITMTCFNCEKVTKTDRSALSLRRPCPRTTAPQMQIIMPI